MKRVLTIFFFLGIMLISSSAQAEKPVIAVVFGKAIKPYNQALAGFEKELKENGYQIARHHYDLNSYKGREEQINQEIRNLNPDLIFTIGTKATLFAQKNFPDSPIVFSMVLNPVKAGVIKSFDEPAHNLTGIALDILPEVQFKKLKDIQPHLKRVGVIYFAKEKEWLKNVKNAAKKADLLVVSKSVDSEADVPVALNTISDKIGVLWAQPDSMIYNAQSSKHILLTLLKHKIPLMAFSASFVKAGALLALECNYNVIGQQAGQVTVKILAGQQPNAIPVAFPKETNLIINKRISEIIGINISANVFNEAFKVYK